MTNKFITALVLLAAIPAVKAQVCFTPDNSVNAYVLGIRHTDIQTADMNGDGHPDLVTADYGADQISIMMWTGTDSSGKPLFSTGVSTAAGNGPLKLYLNDFNHDTYVDIAVVNSLGNTITVMLNDGTGIMTDTNYTVGANPSDVTGGDFDGDGHLDLAVANYTSKTVTILKGSLTGSFTTNFFTLNTASYAPVSVVSGDFDGDGIQDLAMALYSSNNGYYGFAKGSGNGGFDMQPVGTAVTTTANANPDYLVAALDTADFNNDGRPDLALNFVSNYRKAYLVTSSASGFPNTITPYTFNTSPYSYDLVCGDYNGDGNADIAVVFPSGYKDSIKVVLGKGNGSFGAEKTFSSGYLSVACAIAKADFNDDGKPDLVTGNYTLGGTPNGTSSFDVYTLVNTTPWFTISGDSPVCGPQTVTLTATGGSSLTYTWTTATGSASGPSFMLNATNANTPFTVTADSTAGCFNTSYGNVRVITVNTGVGQSGGTLTAYATNAAYQWLGCDLAGDTLIPGETGQSFTPLLSGSYAVEITQNGCMDTSDCYAVEVSLAGMETAGEMDGLRIYPNPNEGRFFVETTGKVPVQNIIVRNLLGQVIEVIPVNGSGTITVTLNQPPGVYLIGRQDQDGRFEKIIVR